MYDQEVQSYAILGLMRKRASPCIKKGLNALQQWSTGGQQDCLSVEGEPPSDRITQPRCLPL